MAGSIENYFRDVDRTFGCKAGWVRRMAAPWIHPGIRAVLCYRIAHRLRRIPGLRLLGALFTRLGTATSGAEIHGAADLGGGVHLPHPSGVVIGPGTQARGECTIFQQVTVGPRTGGANPGEGPTLGRHTFLYPGARVLGSIEVGSRSQVGPNCVVFRDLPEGSTVMPPEPTVLEGLSFTLRFREDEESSNEDTDREASTGERELEHA